jgi:hypothetical protein
MELMKQVPKTQDMRDLCKLHTMIGRMLGNYFLNSPPKDYDDDAGVQKRWDADRDEVKALLKKIRDEPVPTATLPYPELSDSDGTGRKRYDIKMDEVPTALVASDDLKVTMETQVGIVRDEAYGIGEKNLGEIWPEILGKLEYWGLWGIDTPVRYSAPSITHDDIRRGAAAVGKSTSHNRFPRSPMAPAGGPNDSPPE